MTVNKYRPHVFVLPEDDANRQLANGFVVNVAHRQIQILPEAGGWAQVCDSFNSEYAAPMQQYPNRFMVLLIDFDNNINRLEDVKSRIPKNLLDRVFVLGALSKPESLRQAGLGSYETIGSLVATDCRDDSQAIWEHDLLHHNKAELIRVRDAVRHFRFPD